MLVAACVARPASGSHRHLLLGSPGGGGGRGGGRGGDLVNKHSLRVARASGGGGKAVIRLGGVRF